MLLLRLLRDLFTKRPRAQTKETPMSDASPNLAAAATAASALDPGERVKLMQALSNGTDSVTGTTFPTEAQMPSARAAFAADMGTVPEALDRRLIVTEVAESDLLAEVMSLGGEGGE
jgi:hypothetical protein